MTKDDIRQIVREELREMVGKTVTININPPFYPMGSCTDASDVFIRPESSVPEQAQEPDLSHGSSIFRYVLENASATELIDALADRCKSATDTVYDARMSLMELAFAACRKINGAEVHE